MMKKIKALVTKLSGHRGNEYYNILCYAVLVALSFQPAEPQMKVICSEVKKYIKKDAGSISKSISRAVNDIWENGSRETLFEIYGKELQEKPSPKDVVYVIAQYIWINEKEETAESV